MSAVDRRRAIKLVDQAVEQGAQPKAACRLMGISLRTLQRWKKRGGAQDRRKGPRKRPKNALTKRERELVLRYATGKEYRDLSPAQIVPKLADAGTYIASESTFYRILRQERLLRARGNKAERTRHRPLQYKANGPNQVWSWDITYLRSPVKGAFFYLYLIVDIWSRKIVGSVVHEREDNELAARLIRQAAWQEKIDSGQLVLHSDNGGPMKGATMLATLQRLGIVPSFSRPRVSDDNAFSEALFSTIKGRPEYPSKPYESLEAARKWVEQFVYWYNHRHLHSAIRFVTAAARHDRREQQVFEQRKQVYREAKSSKPRRWTREIRNWNPVKEVVLNERKLYRETEKKSKMIA